MHGEVTTVATATADGNAWGEREGRQGRRGRESKNDYGIEGIPFRQYGEGEREREDKERRVRDWSGGHGLRSSEAGMEGIHVKREVTVV